MRRRLVMLLGLVVAFGLGLGLAAGPAPDALQDLWNQLLVAWYGYKLRAGSGGTFYVMLGGFFLGQGVFLAARQLWRGPLRLARSRFSELDAACDPTTGLPSRYGLQGYVERNLRWTLDDPSTRHVSFALLRIDGIEELNARSCTLAGTEVLHAARGGGRAPPSRWPFAG